MLPSWRGSVAELRPMIQEITVQPWSGHMPGLARISLLGCWWEVVSTRAILEEELDAVGGPG